MLYDEFHVGRPSAGLAADPDEEFLRLLHDAVRVPWTAEAGWTVVDAGPGRDIIVARDGLRVRVDRGGELVTDGPHQPGTPVTVRMPPCRPNLSPGFFCVLGSRGEPDGPLARFYLNLPWRSAPALLGGLTDRLENAELPYLVKTLNDPAGYGRRDGTVLYVDDAKRPETLGAIEATLDDLPEPPSTRVPPLALQLLPEVGYAQEPPATAGRLSFGEHRFDVLARFVAGNLGRPFDDLHEEFAAYLVENRIDPRAPYRNLACEAPVAPAAGLRNNGGAA
jgi:hypothetical protein